MVAAMMKGETVNVEADDIPAGEVSKRKRGGEGRSLPTSPPPGDETTVVDPGESEGLDSVGGSVGA